MNKIEKIILWSVVGFITLGVTANFLRTLPAATSTPLGHGGPLETASYDVIGTSATPLALTSSYTAAGSASSSAILAEGQPNAVFVGSYLPKSAGSVAYIQLLRSTDMGANYFPYSTITPESSDVLVNSSGSSTTSGSPFLVPGNALYTSTSGTAIGFSFDLTGVAGYWKVRAKEFTTSTAGTIYLRGTFQSN